MITHKGDFVNINFILNINNGSIFSVDKSSFLYYNYNSHFLGKKPLNMDFFKKTFFGFLSE